MISYGSVCSGIEAASLAIEPLGMKAEWFSQFDPEHNYSKGPDFPSAVLAHHWPSVPNLGDMTKIAGMVANDNVAAPSVLIGGTPCQAYSVAGKRQGMADPRGFLTLKFVELADEIDRKRIANDNEPCVIWWENVPGVLTSKDNAFGCFLGDLAGEDCELQPPGGKWANAGCVYGPQRAIAWRILDAQYFGVAQRRRRVFVIASARNGFDPAKVLFEFDGVRWDIAPSRETKKAVAALTANGVGTCGADDNQAQLGHLIAMAHGQAGAEIRQDYCCPTLTCNHEAPVISGTLNASMGKGKNGQDIGLLIVHGTQDPDTNNNLAHPIGRNQGQENAVLTSGQESLTPWEQQGRRIQGENGVIPTLTSNSTGGMKLEQIFSGSVVRRLTPTECERLQGMPDGHTAIPYRGKPAADGHRYKAIGNSMAVPVMNWIGKRIIMELTK